MRLLLRLFGVSLGGHDVGRLRARGVARRRRHPASRGRRGARRARHVRRPARDCRGPGRPTSWSTAPRCARSTPTCRPPSWCAKCSLRLIPACRCGAAIPTTSSACCTPRICSAPIAAAGGDVSRISAADIALEAWFVPEATTLRDQLQAFLQPQDPFGAGGRRIRRGARADDARGHHRRDRRRHQRRARCRRCRACASSSTAR